MRRRVEEMEGGYCMIWGVRTILTRRRMRSDAIAEDLTFQLDLCIDTGSRLKAGAREDAVQDRFC